MNGVFLTVGLGLPPTACSPGRAGSSPRREDVLSLQALVTQRAPSGGAQLQALGPRLPWFQVLPGGCSYTLGTFPTGGPGLGSGCVNAFLGTLSSSSHLHNLAGFSPGQPKRQVSRRQPWWGVGSTVWWHSLSWSLSGVQGTSVAPLPLLPSPLSGQGLYSAP